MKTERFGDMGKTKRSTDSIIENAIDRQNDWATRRSWWARRNLHRFNIFAKEKPESAQHRNKPAAAAKKSFWRGAWEFWFPILCAVIVILIVLWIFLIAGCENKNIAGANAAGKDGSAAAATAQPAKVPTFDMVRIGADGKIIVSGRFLADSAVSIKINGKIVTTQKTNARGEFVYAPDAAFSPGNYVLRLVGAGTDAKSADDVFVYVSDKGEKNSMSLLMTEGGSKFLQRPYLQNGDLTVSKIDYLENGRIVVQGTGLPRTRVTLLLDNKQIGMAIVSDHKNYGLGADAGTLTPGRDYELTVRLHDGNGRLASRIKYPFKMPEMLPGDQTYYIVRRGDALWIIAKNFIGQGIRYTMIVDANAIKNPDLIYPKQKLRIPITKK